MCVERHCLAESSYSRPLWLQLCRSTPYEYTYGRIRTKKSVVVETKQAACWRPSASWRGPSPQAASGVSACVSTIECLPARWTPYSTSRVVSDSVFLSFFVFYRFHCIIRANMYTGHFFSPCDRIRQASTRFTVMLTTHTLARPSILSLLLLYPKPRHTRL